jgi:predicted nucleic acid-binding protein
MIPAPFKVVLDANVLYPAPIRDTMLRAAAKGLFQPCWSSQILDEAIGALRRDGRMTLEQTRRLRGALSRAFPEALVEGHEALVPAMQNEAEDRHVAAAAMKTGAQVIVTDNLGHFRTLPEGIEAQSAEEFLCNLVDLAPEIMLEALSEQAAALRNPPRSFESLVDGLARLVPAFAAAVREQAERLKNV